MIIYRIQKGVTPFLSAVFDAYDTKKFPDVITTRTAVPQTFDTEMLCPLPDEQHAERVKTAIIKYGGMRTYDDVTDCLRSDIGDKETTAYEYVKLLLKEKRYVGNMLANVVVLNFIDIVKKVRTEAHRMKGFLRFMQLENGNLYAHYTPDNDVTDLILTHFIARYKNFKFAIHDSKRGIMAVYDGKTSKVFSTDSTVTVYISEEERRMRDLWKEYYDSVNIKQRKNKKLQDNSLPVRYRGNMTEFEPKSTK